MLACALLGCTSVPCPKPCKGGCPQGCFVHLKHVKVAIVKTDNIYNGEEGRGGEKGEGEERGGGRGEEGLEEGLEEGKGEGEEGICRWLIIILKHFN